VGIEPWCYVLLEYVYVRTHILTPPGKSTQLSIRRFVNFAIILKKWTMMMK